MKLTSADLDNRIHADDIAAGLVAVQCRNGNDDVLVMSTPDVLQHLPPMNLPQPTEPFFIGETWKHPAPARGASERTHRICDAIVMTICCAVLLWVMVDAVFP